MSIFKPETVADNAVKLLDLQPVGKPTAEGDVSLTGGQDGKQSGIIAGRSTALCKSLRQTKETFEAIYLGSLITFAQNKKTQHMEVKSKTLKTRISRVLS